MSPGPGPCCKKPEGLETGSDVSRCQPQPFQSCLCSFASIYPEKKEVSWSGPRTMELWYLPGESPGRVSRFSIGFQAASHVGNPIWVLKGYPKKTSTHFLQPLHHQNHCFSRREHKYCDLHMIPFKKIVQLLQNAFAGCIPPVSADPSPESNPKLRHGADGPAAPHPSHIFRWFNTWPSSISSQRKKMVSPARTPVCRCASLAANLFKASCTFSEIKQIPETGKRKPGASPSQARDKQGSGDLPRSESLRGLSGPPKKPVPQYPNLPTQLVHRL